MIATEEADIEAMDPETRMRWARQLVARIKRVLAEPDPDEDRLTIDQEAVELQDR